MNKKLVVVLLAAVACEPSVPQQAAPSSVVTAVFDPLTGNIPLPNDLALQGSPALPAAQNELLAAFAAQGGFPNDQEVPVTISFTQQNIAADGNVTNTAPDIDTTTLTPATLVVALNTGAAAGPVALDPIQPSDYANGVLTLHNKGRAPWTPGHYVVAVRGGPNGVKTKEGTPVYASQTFYLIAQGQDLTTEQNLGLLRAQAGSTAAALDLAKQLNGLIELYKAGGAFAAVNQVFPQQELAVMTTFGIAPAHTQVDLDPNRGLVPLPIDLLRDPRPASASCPACGKLTPVAACTLAGGTLNAQGACSSPAAAGFAALDGFSTTAFILAPTNDLVQAKTITPATVQLYDLTDPAHPALVPGKDVAPTGPFASYLTEPCEVTSSCTDLADALSPVIALQPAGATAADNSGSPIPSVFRTTPLKDATDYAVVISDGVLDKAGKKLGSGTVAKVLQFKNPLVDASGASQLVGIDNATAGALEVMRQKLAPVLTAAASNGIGSGHVAMAYTFRTQTILQTAVGLGALPYKPGLPLSAAPGAVTAMTATAAFQKYGVKPTIPSGNIAKVLETTIKTWDLLDPASGAFKPDPATGTAIDIPVLIAVPSIGNVTVPTCSGPLAGLGALGLHCAPMVIFRHGLGGGRANMLEVADTLVGQGFVVVAIDAAKHGDRSFCTGGQTTTSIPGFAVPQCSDGAACVTPLPAGAQGDTNPPGGCAAGFAYRAVSPECTADPASCTWGGAEGIPWVSSNYLVSTNFFRTRDTLRQDFIDQSQLTRALAFVPSGAPPSGNSVFDYMATPATTTGVIIDPSQVYYLGQSLGSVQGAGDVATNPRISKAVLNVGGGTIVDIFTNSSAFVANTDALLASIGIKPGANSAYTQFLVVAKTILDPADPVNFATHLTANTLPNLLANPNGSVPQAQKALLTQMAYCDQVVPNPFGYILDTNIVGFSQMPPAPGFGTGTGNFELFYKFTGTTPDLTTCPSPGSSGSIPANAVNHAFLTNWTDPFTARGQSDAAKFLLDGTKPPSLQMTP
jgi:hypothetical protein